MKFHILISNFNDDNFCFDYVGVFMNWMRSEQLFYSNLTNVSCDMNIHWYEYKQPSTTNAMESFINAVGGQHAIRLRNVCTLCNKERRQLSHLFMRHHMKNRF